VAADAREPGPVVALDPKSARAQDVADVDAALLDFQDELKALQQARPRARPAAASSSATRAGWCRSARAKARSPA
jgi:hypothetical protein